MGDNPPLCYSCSSQIWAWLVAGVGQPPRPRAGYSTMHSCMPPIALPPCPPLLSWSLQAGGCRVMGFECVTVFSLHLWGLSWRWPGASHPHPARNGHQLPSEGELLSSPLLSSKICAQPFSFSLPLWIIQLHTWEADTASKPRSYIFLVALGD